MYVLYCIVLYCIVHIVIALTLYPNHNIAVTYRYYCSYEYLLCIGDTYIYTQYTYAQSMYRHTLSGLATHPPLKKPTRSCF